MPDVILLTVDSLRVDRFSEEFFPNSWEDFQQFVHFENAHSHGVATPLAFPGLFSGLPATGNAELLDTIPTIGELAKGRTVGLPNNPHLSHRRGYSRGFDSFDAGAQEGGVLSELKSKAGESAAVRRAYEFVQPLIGNSGDSVPYQLAEDVREWLEANLTDDSGMVWGHFMDPHYPFTPEGIPDREISVEMDRDKMNDLNDRFIDDEPIGEGMATLERLYEAKIGYLDRQLSRFFDSLRENGQFEESLIVFVADHGEGFGEHGVQSHQWYAEPIDELVRTPLAVKYPGGADGGETIEHLVQHADVHHLIADRAGRGDESPGSALREPGGRTVVSKSNTAIRATCGSGWFIRRRDGTTSSNGDVPRAVREAANDAEFPSVQTLAGDVPTNEPDDVQERLEALGYR